MTRIVVAVLMGIGLMGLGLLTACGESTPGTAVGTQSSQVREPHVLELEVEGTAIPSSLVFTLDGKSSEEQAVRLPWRKRVEVPYGTGDHEWKLTIRYSGGTLSATATVNGRLLTQTSGANSPGSTGTASLDGGFRD